MATQICQMPRCSDGVETLYPTDHGTSVPVCCGHKDALGDDYRLRLWLNESF